MMFFDLLLLALVSALLAMKSLYLGTFALVTGLLIAFQSVRVQFLLGRKPSPIPLARKIKAMILALLFAACFYPFVSEPGAAPGTFEVEFNSESVLPILIVIGLFSATLMAALAVEKRKR